MQSYDFCRTVSHELAEIIVARCDKKITCHDNACHSNSFSIWYGIEFVCRLYIIDGNIKIRGSFCNALLSLCDPNMIDEVINYIEHIISKIQDEQA